MAGLFVHPVVAQEIYKLLPQGIITDEGMFYAGSIAPDAIHAREGFVREEKKHTHLRDHIPDRDFGLEENLEIFHKRVSDFIIKHREREGASLDLYRGYVVHIVTDELFMLSVRQEFCDVMEHMGIAQDDEVFYHAILDDMNRNDLLLAASYESKEEIRRRLEEVQSHQIEEFLTETEINDSRKWVLHRYFYEENELLQPVYISFERMRKFIASATKLIIGMLSEGGSLPQML